MKHFVVTWKRIALFIILANAGLFLAYFRVMPMSILANAIHDDRYFMNQASYLLGGVWQGPYNDFTLIKGPGYGVFVALSSLSGLPLQTTQAALHTAVCSFFAYILNRLTRSLTLGVLTAVLLTWQPLFIMVRSIRDAIYPAQSLLVIALWSSIALVVKKHSRISQWTVSLLAGLATGWLWLTREEGVWILPALGALLALNLLVLAARYRARYAASGILAAMVAVASVQGVAAVNFRKYGVWTSVEVKERNYSATLTLLSNIVAENRPPQAPTPYDVRRAVYAVSPAFATLEPMLEESVRYAGFRLPGDPSRYEFSGGAFMWQLRLGAAHRGHYASATKAAAFYGEIADDIRAACIDGRLRCDRPWFNFLPLLSDADLGRIWPTWLSSLKELVQMESIEVTPLASVEPISEVIRLLNFPPYWAPNGSAEDALDRFPIRVKAYLKQLYGVLSSVLLLAAGLALSVVTFRSVGADRRVVSETAKQAAIVATCCWIAVGSRCMVLTLADISSFNAVHAQYLAPCYYLFLVATLCSIAACILSSLSPPHAFERGL